MLCLHAYLRHNTFAATTFQQRLQSGVDDLQCMHVWCMHAARWGWCIQKWSSRQYKLRQVGKRHLLLAFASFDEALGIGRGVVTLQLTPRILQVLLVAVHTHARRVDDSPHTWAHHSNM